MKVKTFTNVATLASNAARSVDFHMNEWLENNPVHILDKVVIPPSLVEVDKDGHRWVSYTITIFYTEATHDRE